jgi:tetratricopeptide (TPR) repeat protein
MKAERRHELKSNSLAHWLEGLPAFVQEHANRLMLGLILILLVILALQYRARVAAKAAAQSQTDLETARENIDELRAGDFQGQSMIYASTQEAAKDRTLLTTLAEGAISDVLRDTSADPIMQARGQLARGDLYLQLGVFPDLPGATTEPDLALPKSRSDLLDLAEEGYRDALRIAPADQILTRNSARLGLAAVAENRGKWDEAQTWYQQVIDDPQGGSALQDYATRRVQQDATLRQPVVLASDEQTTTAPAANSEAVPQFGPSSPFMPTLSPKDVIATPSNHPATQPATRPS